MSPEQRAALVQRLGELAVRALEIIVDAGVFGGAVAGDVVTSREAAHLAGVDQDELRRWESRGWLTAIKASGHYSHPLYERSQVEAAKLRALDEARPRTAAERAAAILRGRR